MGTVTEIDDGLRYEKDGESIVGVSWQSKGQIVRFANNGYVDMDTWHDGHGISKQKLRDLMIMWLALNYPDTLACDQEEN